MKKEAPLAFRIPAKLKNDLEKIATEELRSTSQVCEIFLTHAVERYRSEGHRFFERLLQDRQKTQQGRKGD